MIESCSPQTTSVGLWMQARFGYAEPVLHVAVTKGQCGSGDEHQPLDALREVGGQIDRDKAAHRVADDARALDAEQIHPAHQVRGGLAEDEGVSVTAAAEA